MYTYTYIRMYRCVYIWVWMPAESRREDQISGSWSYRQLWTAHCAYWEMGLRTPRGAVVIVSPILWALLLTNVKPRYSSRRKGNGKRCASAVSGKGAVELSPRLLPPLQRKCDYFTSELRRSHSGEHNSENTKFKMYATEHAQTKVLEKEVTSTFLAISSWSWNIYSEG